MEKFVMMMMTMMVVMVVMIGVVTAAPHPHYPDIQISIALNTQDEEGIETQKYQVPETQEYTVKIQSAAGVTDEEKKEEEGEGDSKVAAGSSSVSESIPKASMAKVKENTLTNEATVNLNKDSHHTIPSGGSQGHPGDLTKDKPHSSKDVTTTTTTTLDPLTEFCKEACSAGVGGPECDCPDHPIG